jgi:hypothetical protein
MSLKESTLTMGVMKGKGSNFNGQKAMFIFFKSSITL